MDNVRPNHRPPKERIIREPLTKDVYTVFEVADLFHMHFKSIRYMIKNGTLEAYKIGKEWRIKREVLQPYVKLDLDLNIENKTNKRKVK